MDKTETRELTTSEVEIRESDEGKRTISGYAVKWGLPSKKIGGKFIEVFHQGAFAESIESGEQRALWSHDRSKVLGRTKNNTLRLKEDDVGLHFEVDLPNTTLGNDTYESIKRGDVDGASFGFGVLKQKWDREKTKNVVRNILKASLNEVSPVGLPAFPDSEVSIRSIEGFEEFNKQIEEDKKEEIAKINTLIEIGGI